MEPSGHKLWLCSLHFRKTDYFRDPSTNTIELSNDAVPSACLFPETTEAVEVPPLPTSASATTIQLEAASDQESGNEDDPEEKSAPPPLAKKAKKVNEYDRVQRQFCDTYGSAKVVYKPRTAEERKNKQRIGGRHKLLVKVDEDTYLTPENLLEERDNLLKRVQELREENQARTPRYKELQKENIELDTFLTRKSGLSGATKNAVVTECLSPYFTPTQIDCLIRGNFDHKHIAWQEEDFIEAAQLYSFGKRFYNYLRDLHILPLPCVSTLRKKCEGFGMNITTGELTPEFNHKAMEDAMRVEFEALTRTPEPSPQPVQDEDDDDDEEVEELDENGVPKKKKKKAKKVGRPKGSKSKKASEAAPTTSNLQQVVIQGEVLGDGVEKYVTLSPTDSSVFEVVQDCEAAAVAASTSTITHDQLQEILNNSNVVKEDIGNIDECQGPSRSSPRKRKKN